MCGGYSTWVRTSPLLSWRLHPCKDCRTSGHLRWSAHRTSWALLHPGLPVGHAGAYRSWVTNKVCPSVSLQLWSPWPLQVSGALPFFLGGWDMFLRSAATLWPLCPWSPSWDAWWGQCGLWGKPGRVGYPSPELRSGVGRWWSLTLGCQPAFIKSFCQHWLPLSFQWRVMLPFPHFTVTSLGGEGEEGQMSYSSPVATGNVQLVVMGPPGGWFLYSQRAKRMKCLSMWRNGSEVSKKFCHFSSREAGLQTGAATTQSPGLGGR